MGNKLDAIKIYEIAGSGNTVGRTPMNLPSHHEVIHVGTVVRTC